MKIEASTMGIRHLFLWSVNDDSQGQAVLDQLASLGDIVPGLKNWGIGPNTFTPGDDPRVRHFDYALTCDFDTPEELQAYQEHHAHQQIVERVFPLYGDWAVADLTIGH
jgi:hypothetical protein